MVILFLFLPYVTLYIKSNELLRTIKKGLNTTKAINETSSKFIPCLCLPTEADIAAEFMFDENNSLSEKNSVANFRRFIR